MSDRIAVMNEVTHRATRASPSEVYSRPSTLLRHGVRRAIDPHRRRAVACSGRSGGSRDSVRRARLRAASRPARPWWLASGRKRSCSVKGPSGIQQHPGEALRHRLFRAEDQSASSRHPAPSDRLLVELRAPAAIPGGGCRCRASLADGGHDGVSGAMTTITSNRAAAAPGRSGARASTPRLARRARPHLHDLRVSRCRSSCW